MSTSTPPDQPAANTAVLSARDVRKTYDPTVAPVRALRGADLEINAGEFVAMMGPSGCGKSTFLSIAAGLESVDAGSVAVAGTEITALGADAMARLRRRHVGIVFQFFNLVDGMTAVENVALAALVAGTSRRQAQERARDLLDLLGLLDKADKVPSALSGGQRQRLAIARALVNRPSIVLADEPTGALDSDGGAEVLELFGRLNQDGQTILMVTHDPLVAAGASRVVHMRDGRIIDDRSATDRPVSTGVGTDAR